MEEITYLEKPDLYKPYLIIGFEGWPNAAEVSSFSIEYLVDHLKAKQFASIPIEKFYQLSSLRPVGTIKDGRLTELTIQGNHFYYSKNPPSNDFILFHGVEPHFQWSLFADLLLGLAEQFDVSQIFTLGGTYDYTPHTYPPIVSALFNDESLRERIVQAGLGLTEYTGPISIHTFLLEKAEKRGLKAMSLWGHAPQYLQARNVKVVYSVLQYLTGLTEMKVDLSHLESASEYFDQQINHLMEEDPKLQEMISKLEEVYKRSEKPPRFPGKEEKPNVITIQAFLKRQEDGEKKEG